MTIPQAHSAILNKNIFVNTLNRYKLKRSI